MPKTISRGCENGGKKVGFAAQNGYGFVTSADNSASPIGALTRHGTR
jgi:hypothetical protein